jgi:DNA-directed RNA polymerase alpha subunit
MPKPTSEFERDEIVVCIVIAICLGNAALREIYGLMKCLNAGVMPTVPISEQLAMFDPSTDLPDDTPVETVRFPTRILNALSYAGVRTIGEIRESSDETLAGLPDFGRGSIRWLREKIG